MSTETETIETVAQAAYDAFQSVKRGEDTIYTIKDGSPDWIKDAVYDAHGRGRLLPDDWTYEICMDAFAFLADNGDSEETADEFADGVEIYTHALRRWLSDYPEADTYIEQARDEGLLDGDADIDRQLSIGQYMARRDIYQTVVRACEEQLDAEAE